MNPNLEKLFPYPFERLADLKKGATPPASLQHIALSIGEPKHAPPRFLVEALQNNLEGLGAYPMAKGLPELREAVSAWLARRFHIAQELINPDKHIVPVSGTREGLFAFVQSVVDRREQPLVLMPNPFYQIYEGAAFLAEAEPYYLNTFAENGFLLDLDSVPESIWQACQLLFICSPGNPTGATMDRDYLTKVIELADRHDIIVAADECYSEIYYDESTPPTGLLETCVALGRDKFERCVVFHSLSKRSNVPGLRSGFVAGDADIMAKFLLYRTYHGCAMPIPAQIASVHAWNDDDHVKANRALYREKFDAAKKILHGALDIEIPPAAFYLWPATPIDDEEFARRLYTEQNITALPGTYLSRDTSTGNPGRNRIRLSLVADVDECNEAMQRIRDFVMTL